MLKGALGDIWTESRVQGRRSLRWLVDRRRGTRFAAPGDASPFPYTWARHRIVIDPEAAKQFRDPATKLTSIVLRPGQTFSFWRGAGRGELPPCEGIESSPVCRLATGIGHAALLAGLDVIERHHHRRAPAGSAPLDLATDVHVRYPRHDLRFSNPHAQPLQLAIGIDDRGIVVSFTGAAHPGFDITLEPRDLRTFTVDDEVVPDLRLRPGESEVVVPGATGYSVRLLRHRVRADGNRETDDLGETVFEARAGRIRRAP